MNDNKKHTDPTNINKTGSMHFPFTQGTAHACENIYIYSLKKYFQRGKKLRKGLTLQS